MTIAQSILIVFVSASSRGRYLVSTDYNQDFPQQCAVVNSEYYSSDQFDYSASWTQDNQDRVFQFSTTSALQPSDIVSTTYHNYSTRHLTSSACNGTAFPQATFILETAQPSGDFFFDCIYPSPEDDLLTWNMFDPQSAGQTDISMTSLPTYTATDNSRVSSNVDYGKQAAGEPSESPKSASGSTTSAVSSSDATKRPAESAGDTLADKRRRNNAAAAKYRQKKLDKISELEEALQKMSKERDELKVTLAKKDGEIDLLNRLLTHKPS